MAESVYDQITKKLQSEFSIHQYLPFPALWDRVVRGLLKLTAEGKHTMQLDGRLDIASWKIYGDPMLDWVLAVYNGIKRVGSDVPLRVRQTISLTLYSRHSSESQEIVKKSIRKEDVRIVFGGLTYSLVTQPDDSLTVSFSGGPNPDIRLTWTVDGTVLVKNESVNIYSFQIFYFDYVRDLFLMAGQEIIYPNIDDVRGVLQKVQAQDQAEDFTGFARL